MAISCSHHDTSIEKSKTIKALRITSTCSKDSAHSFCFIARYSWLMVLHTRTGLPTTITAINSTTTIITNSPPTPTTITMHSDEWTLDRCLKLFIKMMEKKHQNGVSCSCSRTKGAPEYTWKILTFSRPAMSTQPISQQADYTWAQQVLRGGTALFLSLVWWRKNRKAEANREKKKSHQLSVSQVYTVIRNFSNSINYIIGSSSRLLK